MASWFLLSTARLICTALQHRLSISSNDQFPGEKNYPRLMAAGWSDLSYQRVLMLDYLLLLFFSSVSSNLFIQHSYIGFVCDKLTSVPKCTARSCIPTRNTHHVIMWPSSQFSLIFHLFFLPPAYACWWLMCWDLGGTRIRRWSNNK